MIFMNISCPLTIELQVDFVEWLEWELEISEDPLLDWER